MIGYGVRQVGGPWDGNGFVRIYKDSSLSVCLQPIEYDYKFGIDLEIALPNEGVTASELKSAFSQLDITSLDENTIEKIAEKNGNHLLDNEDEINELDQYLESTLPFDRSFILASVKEDGLALRFAGSPLNNDKEIVSIALGNNTLALQYADPSYSAGKEFMKTRIKWDLDFEQFIYEYSPLLKNREFAHDAFNINFNAYESMPAETKIIYTKKYESIINELKDLNIDFPKRFKSPETVQKIIENRKDLDAADPRPLAVLIYTKRDYNGSFQAHNQIETLVNMGHYRVVYFEAGTDEEVFNALIRATAVKQAKLLVLAGHGDQAYISFGANDPGSCPIENEYKYVDVSDYCKMIKIGLSKCLAKESIVILESCSTGKGKDKATNIANVIGNIFKYSAIIAPTEPAYIHQYQFDNDGNVTGVIYDIGPEKTYSIKKE